MLQRNAGSQPQRGLSHSRLEGQLEAMMKSMAGQAAPAPAAAVPVGEQYLVFSLLDYEFALPASSVQGVERLATVTAVPNVASWVSGVINLRGSISSVVDLRAFLDLEKLPFNPRTRLLSAKYNEMLV